MLSSAVSVSTHEIVDLKPKPPSDVISGWNAEYFDAQADVYDHGDVASQKRERYIASVNEIVANELRKRSNVYRVLSLMCGTGRREIELQSAVRRNIEFVGVEASARMAAIARTRGLSVVQARWEDAQLSLDLTFDAALILYSFGHISSVPQRQSALVKLHDVLKPGASVFVDVFSIEDQFEWGPLITDRFSSHRLDEHGYELGDVFYRKVGASQPTFLHYFGLDEITDLLEYSGFDVLETIFIGYGHRSGEIVRGPDEGCILLHGKRMAKSGESSAD